MSSQSYCSTYISTLTVTETSSTRTNEVTLSLGEKIYNVNIHCSACQTHTPNKSWTDENIDKDKSHGDGGGDDDDDRKRMQPSTLHSKGHQKLRKCCYYHAVMLKWMIWYINVIMEFRRDSLESSSCI